MHDKRQIVFTEFEFGMMAQVFSQLCEAKYKKERKSYLAQLKSFIIGMINLRGYILPKNFKLISIVKVYVVETDEVSFVSYYEGDFE